MGLGCFVLGFGFWDLGFRFGVWGLGFWVLGFLFRVLGVLFWVFCFVLGNLKFGKKSKFIKGFVQKPRLDGTCTLQTWVWGDAT